MWPDERLITNRIPPFPFSWHKGHWGSFGVSQRSTVSRLQTYHLLEAKLGSSCWSQSLQPVAGSLPCSALPWAGCPHSQSSWTPRLAAVLSAPVAPSGFWQNGVRRQLESLRLICLKAAQMKNKQSNLVSFTFLLSVRQMQLLSCVGDQRSVSRSGCQCLLPGLILDGELLANFRRKLARRIMSVKLGWIVAFPVKCI